MHHRNNDQPLKKMKKNVLRGLAGLAILAFGVMVMNALIGLKGTPPVKPRTASARLVIDGVEGRVQALHRMTVLSEVNGVLPVGGKEFREGVRYGAG